MPLLRISIAIWMASCPCCSPATIASERDIDSLLNEVPDLMFDARVPGLSLAPE